MVKEIMTEAFYDDKLGRKDVAEHFKNILLNTDLNVFSLSAQWGGGKTYFIKNLITTMEEESINILYNAWESDFYDMPLIPLLSELFIKMETLEDKDKLKKDINWSKKFAKKICKGTTFHAGINIKGLTCGLNFNPNKLMLDSEYIELKSEINEFKCKLTNIQKTLNKKIIIFIDELDRCNPMYTIKTLEIIKHFFGIPNIIFVLAVDKSQIENSVRTIFGVNKGSESGYLRKFIDVEFQLPDPDSRDFINYHICKIWDKIEYFESESRYYNSHIQRNINLFGYQGDIDTEKEQYYLTEMIFKIVSLLNFSLRDIEKYFIRLSLILDELHDNDILFVELVIVLNAIAMYNLDDFDKYIKLNFEGYLLTVDREILPTWNSLLSGAYRSEIANFNKYGSAEANTKRNNAVGICECLKINISTNIAEQETYLKDYPNKIKYINNFNSI